MVELQKSCDRTTKLQKHTSNLHINNNTNNNTSNNPPEQFDSTNHLHPPTILYIRRLPISLPIKPSTTSPHTSHHNVDTKRSSPKTPPRNRNPRPPLTTATLRRPLPNLPKATRQPHDNPNRLRNNLPSLQCEFIRRSR